MTRVVEAEMTTRGTLKQALARFFKKYPDLEFDWRETFEYMAENNLDFFSDYYEDSCNHIINREWRYALHLDIDEDHIYMCVIERA